MTDQGNLARSQTDLTSSSVSASSHDSVTNIARPRNRRVETIDQTHRPSIATGITKSSGTSYPSQSGTHQETTTPRTLERYQEDVTLNQGPTGGDITQFLGDSLTHGWTSIQMFASTWLSSVDNSSKGIRSSKLHPPHLRSLRSKTWGPSPPSGEQMSTDVGVRSLVKTQDALKAGKTVRVLDSHEGVNGGLGVAGKQKCRTSDEIRPLNPEPEEHLAYVHKVEPNDTYAGIILRYKCREDIFRKSNGLWSRDSVQMRKWLVIPVDACEIKGRPCDPPSWFNNYEGDFLVRNPAATGESSSAADGSHGGNFNVPTEPSHMDAKLEQTEYLPWSHVRWVQVDSFRHPVEIVRVARQTLGYFPPRRKKSIRTESSMSTPRQSSDLSSVAPHSNERPSTRRLSAINGRAPIPGTPMSSKSGPGGELTDSRPAWMRRPGGVGPMGRSVREPGPVTDYFNSWTRKHIPGLDMESLPSMSIMGSETANFGFGQGASGIVESPFEDGRNASSISRQVTGLDRAAAAVEHWLRGALTKRPSTPLLGGRLRPLGLSPDPCDTDLIELTYTASDDGKPVNDVSLSLLDSGHLVATGMADSGPRIQGRNNFGAGGRAARKKDD
ncbi:uncharacterized protein MAM_04249 [Metarhizium album ARSEF 1941]|uniref:LysM domain-containing protein n=1 Tax=Metarhizium album (strain ARSEF 1941) TaxID=1081103 RepID=A0A0B2WYD6_METAS|nr:uncharacterized protein MAM_04249 [Metarhizium album ARSEF 1941]KHN97860.1 hypothetical protein MAM_04249 [Metarhizium album ARSEF 1941]